MWTFHRCRTNKLLVNFKESFRNFVENDVFRTIDLSLYDRYGKKKRVCEISFQLYFQEIYNFRISLRWCHVTGNFRDPQFSNYKKNVLNLLQF